LVGSIFHMTRKIVSEMTYNVSMGTLNPTIPYLKGSKLWNYLPADMKVTKSLQSFKYKFKNFLLQSWN